MAVSLFQKSDILVSPPVYIPPLWDGVRDYEGIVRSGNIARYNILGGEGRSIPLTCTHLIYSSEQSSKAGSTWSSLLEQDEFQWSNCKMN